MSGASNGSTGSYAFLAEAKGIQRYVFDSGPLRDLVGASDLVAGLASAEESETSEKNENSDLIGLVFQAVTGSSEPPCSRRASGTFCLHSDNKDQLNEVRALWRLAAQLRCPGLEMSESIPSQPAATAIEAMKAAYERSSGIRFNTAAELLPAGNPFTMYVRRTGKPATNGVSYDGEQVHLDLLTQRHRDRSKALADTDHTVGRTNDLVADRFLDENDGDGRAYRFPRNLDFGKKERDTLANPKFPFRSEGDTRIAVVHGDLSGLGQMFQAATAKARKVEQVLGLARDIEASIAAAAQAATKTILEAAEAVTYGEKEIAIVPARPIVLGGDEITVLVRADLALAFTARLLEEIEKQTKAHLASHRETLGKEAIPERLSACAGVAIVKRGQPFLMAYELANGLCTFAKRKAKSGGRPPYPSALAFHVAGSSMQEKYDAIRNAEMKTKLAGADHCLTANPYGVGLRADRMESAAWDALLRLARAINRLPAGQGGLRELRTLAFEGSDSFSRYWTRWREVAEERSSESMKEVLTALGALDVRTEGKEEQPPLFNSDCSTPLFDALDLIDLGTDLGEPVDRGLEQEPAA